MTEPTVDDFDPNAHRQRCQAYLSHALGAPVRLLRAERLPASTRAAPWRLDVDAGGLFRSYVLRTGTRGSEHEVRALQAVERLPVPTPKVYGWDPEGQALGLPCYLLDFIEGESLLAPMMAGEPWAEALYLDAVLALQAITRDDLLASGLELDAGETAADVLQAAHEVLTDAAGPLAEAAYTRLVSTMPETARSVSALRFSNGDLWLDNFLVRDRQLAAVIDFTNAGFSDPLFEFLLSFFVAPDLRGRGIEERYCGRMGIDAGDLNWYHGLELFDTWHWIMRTGEPFVHYTEESLRLALARWLDGG